MKTRDLDNMINRDFEYLVGMCSSFMVGINSVDAEKIGFEIDLERDKLATKLIKKGLWTMSLQNRIDIWHDKIVDIVFQTIKKWYDEIKKKESFKNSVVRFFDYEEAENYRNAVFNCAASTKCLNDCIEKIEAKYKLYKKYYD